MEGGQLTKRIGSRPIHGMLKRGKNDKIITDCKYCDTFEEVLETLKNFSKK